MGSRLYLQLAYGRRALSFQGYSFVFSLSYSLGALSLRQSRGGSILYLAPMPIVVVLLFFLMRKDLTGEREYRPFLLTVALFLMGYIGVCFAIFPYIVPYQMTIYEAAAADTSLSFMLVGAVIMLPIILSYTAFAYYTFKGKTDHEHMY